MGTELPGFRGGGKERAGKTEKEQRVGREEGQASLREQRVSRRQESTTAFYAAGRLGKTRKETEALVGQHVGC